jgi:hypothetical protein
MFTVQRDAFRMLVGMGPLEDPCLSAVIVVDVIGESEFEQT